MKRWMLALLAALSVSWGVQAQTVEPDHEVHEQLRGILRGVEAAIANGQYDAMLPLLDERVAATSITQDVLSSRADVSNYFKTWFGPSGYMKSMTMKLTADALTELSPDKTWGLVRGDAIEHYEAKDGFQFDFKTRWTAVVTQGRRRPLAHPRDPLRHQPPRQSRAHARAHRAHALCVPRRGGRAGDRPGASAPGSGAALRERPAPDRRDGRRFARWPRRPAPNSC